jgi:capsular polysaccharide transport system permease protein
MSGGTALFVATGAVPCLLFQYVSREIIKGYSLNKPLTYYPQVKIFDVILSRIIVEIVSGFMGAMVVLALLSIFSSQVLPADPAMAMISYFMAIALGIGIGFINVGLVAFFPGWTMGYVLFCIVNYMIAGVVFMPHYLPAEIYYYLKFNPVVDIIELMRLSYDTSLAVEINYIYVSFFIVLTLLVGLMMERFILRRMS